MATRLGYMNFSPVICVLCVVYKLESMQNVTCYGCVCVCVCVMRFTVETVTYTVLSGYFVMATRLGYMNFSPVICVLCVVYKLESMQNVT